VRHDWSEIRPEACKITESIYVVNHEVIWAECVITDKIILASFSHVAVLLTLPFFSHCHFSQFAVILTLPLFSRCRFSHIPVFLTFPFFSHSRFSHVAVFRTHLTLSISSSLQKPFFYTLLFLAPTYAFKARSQSHSFYAQMHDHFYSINLAPPLFSTRQDGNHA
jgi:hypothetical protein